MTFVDLRSDTVTKPTSAMREAMSNAPVGDDVYGEDPSINQLQEQVATLLGKEAALFVPSGSMANQIAILVHCKPGDGVIMGADSHAWLYESGAAAAIGGVQTTMIPGNGFFNALDVEQSVHPDDHHYSPTRLVWLENTHNRGGGIVWPWEQLREVTEAAKKHSLALHLDGARLWNASVAAGKPERKLAAPFDTVSVCLSKGLGAPVGSLIAGTHAHIRQAHRYRKMLGGGMRQGGILAAAGIYALEHHRERLAEDHLAAGMLAHSIDVGSDSLSVDIDSVETNIVIAQTEIPATDIVQRGKEQGILFSAIATHRIRLVTHLGVSPQEYEKAAAFFRSV